MRWQVKARQRRLGLGIQRKAQQRIGQPQLAEGATVGCEIQLDETRRQWRQCDAIPFAAEIQSGERVWQLWKERRSDVVRMDKSRVLPPATVVSTARLRRENKALQIVRQLEVSQTIPQRAHLQMCEGGRQQPASGRLWHFALLVDDDQSAQSRTVINN